MRTLTSANSGGPMRIILLAGATGYLVDSTGSRPTRASRPCVSSYPERGPSWSMIKRWAGWRYRVQTGLEDRYAGLGRRNARGNRCGVGACGSGAGCGPHGVRPVSEVAKVPHTPRAVGTYRMHLIDLGTGLSVLVQGHAFNLLFDGGSNDD